jgi:hypothetical protein
MHMTFTQKKEIITKISELLDQLIEVETVSPVPVSEASADKPLEMLTVKECAALVDGLSENTIRQLCAQDKIAYVRAGVGRHGKILVSKVSLLKYLGIVG